MNVKRRKAIESLYKEVGKKKNKARDAKQTDIVPTYVRKQKLKKQGKRASNTTTTTNNNNNVLVHKHTDMYMHTATVTATCMYMYILEAYWLMSGCSTHVPTMLVAETIV